MSLHSLLKSAWVALVGLSLIATGEAAEVRRFAAVSLLGSSVNVVTRHSGSGGPVCLDGQENFKRLGGVFDMTAVHALKEAVVQNEPMDSVKMLELASATLLGDPDKLIEGNRLLRPAMLEDTLKRLKATHLLLVVPYRSDADINAVDSSLGNCLPWGLGYYLGHDTSMQQHETGERHIGYVAPYVRIKLALVNLVTAQVEGEHLVEKALPIISERSESAGELWGRMTTLQKLATLSDVLKQEIKAGMLTLLAKP